MSCKKERNCVPPHTFVEAVPELRRHCTRCGLEQKGHEVEAGVVWETVREAARPCA